VAVLVLSNALRDVPRELYEAMTLDGGGPVLLLRRLVLPLSRPAISTVGIYTAINAWNGFLFPLILTQSDDKRVLTVRGGGGKNGNTAVNGKPSEGGRGPGDRSPAYMPNHSDGAPSGAEGPSSITEKGEWTADGFVAQQEGAGMGEAHSANTRDPGSGDGADIGSIIQIGNEPLARLMAKCVCVIYGPNNLHCT